MYSEYRQGVEFSVNMNTFKLTINLKILQRQFE